MSDRYDPMDNIIEYLDRIENLLIRLVELKEKEAEG